jgi:phosphatidylethanolamine-binding protein
MLSFITLAVLAFTPQALSQSTGSSSQVSVIEAHFKQAQIVPSLLPTFEPTALLSINYAGKLKQCLRYSNSLNPF